MKVIKNKNNGPIQLKREVQITLLWKQDNYVNFDIFLDKTTF